MTDDASSAAIPPRRGFQDVLVAVLDRPYHELVPFGIFEAVVSSDDTALSMRGGVSAELARLGGSAYVEEVRRQAPAAVGDVVVTSAGDMPVGMVLHAITIDWATNARPTERTLRQIVREIFARAESLEAEHVLLPLVASGVARFDRHAAAEIIFEVLVQHLQNESVLRHVALSVPDPEVHAACERIFPQVLERFEGRPRVDLVFTRAHGRSTAPAPPSRVRISYKDSWDASVDTPEPEVPNAPPPDPGPAPAASMPAAPAAPAAMRQPEVPQPRSRPLGPPAKPAGLGGLWRRIFRTKPVLPDPAELPRPAAPDATVVFRHADTPSRSPTRSDDRPRAAEAAAPPTDHVRPVLANRYVLLEELGRGGFGIVHLSWDLVLRRVVAIKQLRSDVRMHDVLRREAAIALELSHDCIVRTHHFEPASAGSGAFIVMEYVPWPTAERWLANLGDQLPPPRVVAEIGLRVCNALEYAHARQVLHLDLKPANVFVDVSAEQVKLGDFGLARISSTAGRVLPESPAGTPGYMAPEQLVAGTRLTPATDVYQLAATLWDLLLGEAPRADARVPHASDPSRTRVLEAIRPALCAQAADRPASASRLRERLAACT